MPKVSIIILNWNGSYDTMALLASLEKVTFTNFSVLVVDNASSDDSLGQIARYMEEQRRLKQSALSVALLPLSKNYGYAQGNNKGVLHASRDKPDYYLLLNNDTLVRPDFLAKLVAAAEANPKVGAVCPTIYFADSKSGAKSGRVWYAGGWINFYAGGAHHKTELPAATKDLIPTEFTTGCCLLVRKTALLDLKLLFDPTFFAYNEDVDLGLRLRQKGWQLGYVPQSILWHKLATSSGGPKSSNFWYYNVRNNFLLMRRYAKWYHWPIFILYFICYKPVLSSVIGAIIRPRADKPQRLLAIVQGIFDAATGKFGKR